MNFVADLTACRLIYFMSGFLVWLLYMMPVAPSRMV